MPASVAALSLLPAAAPAGAGCDHATVDRVVDAILHSADPEVASRRLSDLAPESEATWDWAPEVLGGELLTGHARNEVWAALCAFPGDGASWAVTGGIALEVAASDRAGLIERALDGQQCALQLFEKAVAHPPLMAETFSSCELDELEEMGRTLAGIRGRLAPQSRGARLLGSVRESEAALRGAIASCRAER